MAWMMKLVRSGDSIVVTVPHSVVRRWQKAGAVAVLWELEGNTLRATPQSIHAHNYGPIPAAEEEDVSAGSDHQP